MTEKEALKVLVEHQKWRRGEEPYGWSEDPVAVKPMPYSPKEVGEALDIAIGALSFAEAAAKQLKEIAEIVGCGKDAEE